MRMLSELFKTKVFRRRRRLHNHPIYITNKDSALNLAITRINHFNKIYNFLYNKITIRNQSSRWGSCSRKGNLSFNYRLALLPPELADYIIVHELCHLGEFNHSKKFWDLVEKAIPNWPKLRAELKVYNKSLF